MSTANQLQWLRSLRPAVCGELLRGTFEDFCIKFKIVTPLPRSYPLPRENFFVPVLLLCLFFADANCELWNTNEEFGALVQRRLRNGEARSFAAANNFPAKRTQSISGVRLFTGHNSFCETQFMIFCNWICSQAYSWTHSVFRCLRSWSGSQWHLH